MEIKLHSKHQNFKKEDHSHIIFLKHYVGFMWIYFNLIHNYSHKTILNLSILIQKNCGLWTPLASSDKFRVFIYFHVDPLPISLHGIWCLSCPFHSWSVRTLSQHRSLSFTRQHDPHSQFCSHPEVFVLPFSIAEKDSFSHHSLEQPISFYIYNFFLWK